MMSEEMPGQVITFYSYKGGTGRSMALANIACLLAQRQSLAEGRGVLIIDWDLEAPGLHRYFRDKFRNVLNGKVEEGETPTISQDPDQQLDLKPGLIDLFVALDVVSSTPDIDGPAKGGETDGEPHDEEMARAVIERVNPEQFILPLDVPSLYIMKAGRFDEHYATLVSTFQWEALYNRSPWLIRVLAEYLAERFEYILIDSRTGITDISGICTMLLPERLVVVFTPNRQSLLGVQELVRRATSYRRQSDDLRPLVVFPLPSRIEATEPTLRDQWRLGNEKDDIPGYQPLFEKLFQEVYDVSGCDLNNYFNEVQIQHAPSYAYGENVAVLFENSGGRLSLPQSYETVVDWLVDTPVPWKQEATNTQNLASEQVKLAEATYARLSLEEQGAAKRLFTRLVHLARPEEGGEDTRQRVKFGELFPAEQAVAKEWLRARLVVIRRDANNSDTTVEPSSESLIREWKRLRTWLEEDRDFLLWRQSVRADIAQWESSGRQDNALLYGVPLEDARQWLRMRTHSLNDDEKFFINASITNQELKHKIRNRLVVALVTASILVVSLAIVAVLFFWRGQEQRKEVQKEVKTNFDQAVNKLEEGQASANAGNYKKAVAAFDAAIQLNPEFAEAYLERGKANYALGNSGDAMSDFNQAIKLQDDNAESYFYRGKGYAGTDNPSLALADFNHALLIRRDYYEALYERSQVYAKLGDKQSAIADLKVVRDQDNKLDLKSKAIQHLQEYGEVEPQPKPIVPPPDAPLAVCNGNDVFVRTGPGLENDPITKIYSGQRLWVIEISTNETTWNGITSKWKHVQLYNSSIRGWVFGQFVTLVNKSGSNSTTTNTEAKDQAASPAFTGNSNK